MPEYKLIYFNARGRAELIRVIFAVAGVRYEDFRMSDGREEWPELKTKVPFGQVPILEVDGKPMAQSFSIARYLAREFGLAGKSEWEQVMTDVYVEATRDILQHVINIRLAKTDEQKEDSTKRFLAEFLPQTLNRLSITLSENPSGFLVGDELTWADIALMVIVPRLDPPVFQETLHKYPNILKHRERMEKLPRIAAWIQKRPKTDM